MIKGWAGIGLWLLCQSQFTIAGEYFDEQLTIRPLQDGRLYTNFAFKTLLEDADPRSPGHLKREDESQHYTVFPLALGQIIREYAVTELHVSLNAGKWNYAAWGHPDNPGVGTGAELWAWMGEGETGSFGARWQGLRNSLAGLFCASLGELDERRTASPSLAFRPDGDLPTDIPHKLVYAFHPSENVCTENLTPFIKLLPCKSGSGIASLLNPHRLFDADWHGLSVQVLWKANEGVEIILGVQAVFDPIRLRSHFKRDWTFSQIFDRSIIKACPVARSSNVLLALPEDGNYSVSPDASSMHANTVIYDVNTISKPLDVSLTFIDEKIFQYPHEPVSLSPLLITRSQTGTSQTSGHLHVSFINTLPVSQRVVYLEMLPWIIKPYIHTLMFTIDGEPHPHNHILENLAFFPARDLNPTLFEPVLNLPPNSTVHLSFAFDKTFLPYTQHPPDAHRGWDIPPAVIIPLSSNTSFRSPRMYTNNLLVDLATPDFSMPYNVIIMTCTLLAMFFGNIFNLLTRQIVAVRIP